MIIFCFSTLISLSTFLIVVGFFFTSIGEKVEQNQKNEFNESVKSIRNLIESGASFQYLDHYRMEGYTIIISDSSQNVIYPIKQSADEQNFQIIKMITDNQTLFTSGNYHVYVSYPTQVNSSDVSGVILQQTPIILSVSLLLTVVCGILYSYYYVREKRKLEIIFKMMEENTKFEEIENFESTIRLYDYFLIEKQVVSLYKQLQISQRHTVEQIDCIKQLEQEKKMLLEGFTHEMKTPIMASQLLVTNLSRSNLDDYQLSTVAKTKTELKKLDRLTKEILFIFHNKDKQTYGQLSILNILEQIITDYEVLWKDKELNFVFQIEQDMNFFYNKKLTKKIFTNLVSNAIFHSKLKSDIVIILRESSVTISNSFSNNDRIDPNQIVQPFYSSGTNAGTGLGLYMVKTALSNSNYKCDITCRNTFEITISKK